MSEVEKDSIPELPEVKLTGSGRPRKKHFLNNADLYAETIKSQDQGFMTDNLAKMLLLLCKRYRKSRNGDFTRHTFFDEMVSAALVNLCDKAWHKFDRTRGVNTFAFFTSCIHNSYLQFIKKEKKQRDIRDKLLVINGLDASFNYMEKHGSHGSMEGSDDVTDTNEVPDHVEEVSGKAARAINMYNM